MEQIIWKSASRTLKYVVWCESLKRGVDWSSEVMVKGQGQNQGSKMQTIP